MTKQEQVEVAKALVEAAFELEQRDLWREEAEIQPFVVRLDSEPHPLIAAFVGDESGDRGLLVARGENAIEEFSGMLDLDEPDFDGLASTAMLHLHVARLSEVAPPLRGLPQAAGIAGRREMRVPIAIAKLPGREPRSATAGEMRVLLGCVRGILAAEEQGEFAPERLDPDGESTLELTVREDLPDPEDPFAHDALEYSLAEIEPEDAPRLAGRWYVAVGEMPELAVGCEGGAPRLYAVIDEASGTVLHTHLVRQGLVASLTKSLVQAIRGESEGAAEPGLPREIAFSDAETLRALGPELEALEVACVEEREHPLLGTVFVQIADALRKMSTGEGEAGS
jgi:hypothetical protein